MIQWTVPAAFWGLLSLGAILALHFYLRRPPIRTVSSTILYSRLAADVRKVQPRSRLQWSSLLALQLMIALLLTLAATQPGWLGWSSTNRVVLVIDGSASMWAEDVEPNRFAAATAQAQVLIRDSGQATALILAGDQPRLIHGFSLDKDVLHASLAGLDPSLSEPDWNAALELAEALLQDDDQGEILVLTDGVARPPSTGHWRLPQWITVGESGENVGITALDAVPSGRNLYDVMLRIENFGSEPLDAALQMLRRSGPTVTKPVMLPPGEAATFFFTVQPQGLETFTFVLDHEDLLPVDNEAILTLGRERLPRTALLSPGNVFLERALLSYPEVRLFVVDAYDPSGDYDLWVFDGTAPDEPVERGLFFFHPPTSIVSAEDVQIHGEQLQLSGVNTTHALARFLEWDGLRAVQFASIAYGAQIQPLLSFEDRVLAAADASGERRWVYLGLDLLQSNFPLSVEFPLFIGNAVDWLVPPTIASSGVLSAEESNIAPRSITTSGADEFSPSDAIRTVQPLAAALAWLVLALLLAEWLLFNRRRGGSGA